MFNRFTRADLVAVALCLLYVCGSSLYLDTPGIQADEALFSMGDFYPQGVGYSMSVFHRRIPLMQMSYLGSLKAWVYAPVFAVMPATAWTLRLPAILLGGLTLWLLYRLLRAQASAAAGLFAVALLAADPMFVWTTRCDWGPVALQRFLVVGGVLAISRAGTGAVQGSWNPLPAGRGSFGVVGGVWARCRGWVGLGAFLFGLALWDKTVAVWMIAGLAVAAATVYGRQCREWFTWRRIGFVLLWLVVGCWPLVRYNLAHKGETAKQTARFAADDLPGKAMQLRLNLDGRALFGFLVRENPGYGPQQSLTALAVGLAAVLLVWVRSRLALFCFLASAVAWGLMAVTVGAGGSAHHASLIWPWPQAMAAIVFTQVAGRRRWVAVGIATVLFVSSAAVTVRYYRLALNEGSDPPWSTAIYPMAEYLGQERPTKVMVNDWGILDPVRLLTNGFVPLETAFDRAPEVTVGQEGVLFVGHTDRYQMFDKVNQRIQTVAGYRKKTVRVFTDRQGNEVFEVFRFERE